MVRALLLLLLLPLTAITADVHSEPATITVAQARSQGVVLTVTPKISTTRPWVREQVLVTLEVITPDRFASLVIEPQPLPGFEVIPLASERERIETADGERTRLRIGLALFALLPGTHRMSLPPVQYRLDGGTRRLFLLPEPILEVKALPPYVPPTLPVGRINIETALERNGSLRPGELAILRLRLKAKAMPSHWLPPLYRSLSSNEQVRYLPPQSDYSEATDSFGVNAMAEHRIPLSALGQGRLALPTLKLDYFDPATGRLERIVHQPPRPIVFGFSIQIAIVMLILVGILWAAPKLWRSATWLLRCRRERRAALDDLARAEDAATLRAGLRRYAAAAGGPSNISLGQLQQQLGEAVKPEMIKTLSVASYAPSQGEDLFVLRRAILEQLQ